MKLNFTYNREKDIWCILNKGNSSNNSLKQTRTYIELLKQVDMPLTEEKVSLFIDRYLQVDNIKIEQVINKNIKEFLLIQNKFITITEKVFSHSIDNDISVFLTINNRCPYNIEENWFFISINGKNQNPTIMHELWHFYTWKKFGKAEQEKIGKEKYNTIKEALSVLLNVECSHLFPIDISDTGYPQHKKLRENILKWWKEKQDIDYIWKKSLDFIEIKNQL